MTGSQFARTPLKEEKICRREQDGEALRPGICAILHEIVGEFISSVLWGGPPLYGRPSVWSVETELVWNATRAFVLCLFGVNEHADSRKLLPTIKQGQTNVKYLSQFCHIAVVKPLFSFPLSRQNRRMTWVIAVRSAKLCLEETFRYSKFHVTEHTTCYTIWIKIHNCFP